MGLHFNFTTVLNGTVLSIEAEGNINVFQTLALNVIDILLEFEIS
jgi:hypothetical protein